jgi:hypothetical protein
MYTLFLSFLVDDDADHDTVYNCIIVLPQLDIGAW